MNDAITTVVYDGSTSMPWSGTEVAPASAYDTASLQTSGSTPTGSVTYTLFSGTGCNGTGQSPNTVTLAADGSVPPSPTATGLAAGQYSYQAAYSGDLNYSAVTSCTSFTVLNATTLTLTLDDASTNAQWSGSETTGAGFYLTVSLAPSNTPAAGGSINYFLYNGTCTGSTLDSESGVPVTNGTVPSSVTFRGGAGMYCFVASYSGDSNYAPATNQVTFSIAAGTSSTATAVDDASSNAAWAGSEVTGASAYDTSQVTVSQPIFAPTGNVTYTFFANSSCTGQPVSTSVKALNSGSAPNSATTSPLAEGSYSFQATYAGDTNWTGSTSGCEPFTVARAALAALAVSTTVYDAAQGSPWTNSEMTGATAYDTATVTGNGGITPTGTVTYAFYPNGTCTSTPTWSQTGVQMTNGSAASSKTTAALADGTYGFQVVYSGDSNYAAATGSCESFTVGVAPGSIGTNVYDEATSLPWSGSEVTGASAYDTATVSGNNGIAPTGTVTYSFFTNGTCTGTAAATSTEMLASGMVPASSAASQLGAGIYGFQATYNGDGNYQSSTSSCEQFTVKQASTTAQTIVGDASTMSAWSTNEVTGAQAYDTATVGGAVTGFTPTGSVTYSFYTNGTCAGTAAWTQAETLTASGAVPNSPATVGLGTGSYSFQATYGGDPNYVGSTAGCEPFRVQQASSGTLNAVYDVATNMAWAGNEVTGAQAYDTSTVTGVAGFTATGTVTYDLYDGGTCSGTSVSSQTVMLNANGTVPSSSGTATLADGTYSYRATYSGDPNYKGSQSLCASFSVQKAGLAVSTTVYDASTSMAWTGTETPGASAYDLATVAAKNGITPTGSITYSFYKNGTCTGTATTTQMVPLGQQSSSTGALLPGSYSFQAAYSGDGNYQAGTSSCEPFTVQVNPIVITPSSATVAPLGRVSFGATGGTGTGYSWSILPNSSGGNIVAGAYQAGGVGGGTDVVKVTDSLGETQTANVTVTAALSLVPTAPSTPPRGTIAFDASGGATPYSWKLQSNGSGATINTNTGAYVAGPTGITSDTVVVTDANGASVQTVITVTAGVSISPANPSSAPSGMIAFTAMGGSAKNYVWSLSTNRSGGTIDATTGAYVAGTKGMVSDVVTVTDSLGNTASVSVSVGGGVSITPFDPSVPPRGTQAFTATGGSGSGYTWKLTANASGGSVAASTGQYTAGSKGSNTDVLQVTDSLGNIATTNITVTAGIAISPTTATVAPLGTVSFAASGGSGSGYTFSLTSPSGGSINASTGAYKAGTIGNVTDGVQVTDSLGNTATATVSVTAALAITPTSASVAPRGGTTFRAGGGSGTYVFSLRTNASGGSITVQGAYTAGATPNVVDVVSVVDTNGAIVTANVTVGARVTISPVTPSVAPGGTVQFTAMGGSGTGYLWTLTTNRSGGGISVGGAYTAGSAGNTVDTVKVTDSLGNTATTAVSVGGGLALFPTLASTPPRGKVSFNAIGGSGGYHYAITTNASGGSIDTNTGAYTAGSKGSVTDFVTVTDSRGTTSSAEVDVGPEITVAPATATVMTGGMVPFAVSGGSGVSYAWSIMPDESGGTINASTGTYTAGGLGGTTDTVVVTDSLGNTGTATVTVKANPMMGGDGGVDSGTPEDGGTKVDAGPMGNDASTSMDGSMAGMDGSSTGGNDGGFEVDGSNADGGGSAPSNGSGSCGCTVVGVDTSGFGALGGLALGLALALRRRRR